MFLVDTLFIGGQRETHIIRGVVDNFPFTHLLGRTDIFDPTLPPDKLNDAMQRRMQLGMTSSTLVVRPSVSSNHYLHAAFHSLVEPNTFLRPGDVVTVEVLSHRTLRYEAPPEWVLEGHGIPAPKHVGAILGTSDKEEEYELGVITHVLAVNGIPTDPREEVVMRGVVIPGRKVWNSLRDVWPLDGGYDPDGPLPATGFEHFLAWLFGAPWGIGDKYLLAGPTGSGKSTLTRNMTTGVGDIDTVAAMVGEHEQDIPQMQRALAGRSNVILYSAPVQHTPERKIRIYELAVLTAARLTERNWWISRLTRQAPWPVLFVGDSITSGVQDALNRKPTPAGLGTLSGGRNPLVPFAALTVAAAGRRLANGVSLTAVNVVLLRGPEDLSTYKELRGATRAALTADPKQVAARNFPGLRIGTTAWTVEGRNTVVLPDAYSRSFSAYAKPEHIERAAALQEWLNATEEDERVRRWGQFITAAREVYQRNPIRPIGEYNTDPMPSVVKEVYEAVGVKPKVVIVGSGEVIDLEFVTKVEEYCRTVWPEGIFPERGLKQIIKSFVVEGREVSAAVAERVTQRLVKERRSERRDARRERESRPADHDRNQRGNSDRPRRSA